MGQPPKSVVEPARSPSREAPRGNRPHPGDRLSDIWEAQKPSSSPLRGLENQSSVLTQTADSGRMITSAALFDPLPIKAVGASLRAARFPGAPDVPAQG